jgi:hypothetical protein
VPVGQELPWRGMGFWAMSVDRYRYAECDVRQKINLRSAYLLTHVPILSIEDIPTRIFRCVYWSFTDYSDKNSMVSLRAMHEYCLGIDGRGAICAN